MVFGYQLSNLLEGRQSLNKSVPCKMIEHIVCKNIMAHPDEHKLLSDKSFRIVQLVLWPVTTTWELEASQEMQR